jgi:transcriptional regulator with XRE-family HTH domain
MSERETFGVDLRQARERRGLTLHQVADQTKVSAALFAAMERNDFSRWPAGIFRRAFIRSYAEAVGLDPDDVVSRFTRLFPDPGPDNGVAARGHPAPAAFKPVEPMPRIVPDDRRPGSPLPTRLAAAAVDILLAVVPGIVVGLVFGPQWFWVTAACLGLTGHIVVSLTGTTPGGRLMMGAPSGRRSASKWADVARQEISRSTSAPATAP